MTTIATTRDAIREITNIANHEKYRTTNKTNHEQDKPRTRQTTKRTEPAAGMSRVVVVTGGGRGIGRAIALALAEPEGHVIVTGRTAAQLDSTAAEIRARGAEATALPMDVADEASVAHGCGTLHGRVRHLDVLVNNAGVGGGEAVQGSDVARWKRTIDTNLTGMYLVTRQILPFMRDGGRVINMSSVLGRFGVAKYTAYCASKHGVIGFTRALAHELVKRHITVNALSPGWVETEMAEHGMTLGAQHSALSFDEFKARALAAVPIKRMIDPHEVAALVRFLCSPEASAITGQTYNICGGQTMD
ncbi:MAG: SDR family NAD(P)-dependent oxidoreductase [Vicinamibacterales bacterium]